MKKNNRERIQNVIQIILIVVAIPCFTEASLSKGSSFTSFFWTMNTNDTVKNGCYGYTQVDSVSTETGKYFSTFWLSKYNWWQELFTNTYIKTTITTSNGKPAAITEACNRFSTVEWFTGFERDGSSDLIRFYFPLLPQSTEYDKYDYFKVDVNDTVNLEFYGGADNIMVGTFVHKRLTAAGNINILARDAFVIELTKANPLRIKSIWCNSTYKTLLNAYLKFNLDTFKKNVAWYGIDIIDTLTNRQKIIVHSIDIKGTLPLKADSTYEITWKLNLPSAVDSCLIDASFDNKKTWNRIGITKADSSFKWKIPQQKSDSTYIRITACGMDGEKAYAISANRISITTNPKTGIGGLVENFYVIPSFIPSMNNEDLRIHYTLPGKIKEIAISLFDLKGRCIERIFRQSNVTAGEGSLQLNTDLKAGYYFIQLRAILENRHDPIIMSKKWIQM